MNNNDLLARLAAAETPQARSWIITQALLESLEPEVQAAAWAAAVPHWFNAAILAALLERPLAETRNLYAELQKLPFVEPFAARNGHNVHEVTRAAMLDYLWRERRDEFMTLAARAAAYFGQDDAPEWQIERTYHLLISHPGQGADAIWSLGADWNNSFHYDLTFALTQAGLEHAVTGRCQGRAAGWVYFWHGREESRLYEHARAITAFQKALQSVEQDRQLQANCIQALGDVHVRLSEYGEARARYEEALPLYRTIGDRLGEANCIQALGDVHVRLSEYGEARARYEEALPLYRTIGDRLGEANCIKALGDVHVRLSEYGEARARYEEALPLYRTIGDRLGEANCIKALGDVHVRLSEYGEAPARYEEALPLYRTIGDRLGEANCIQALGDVHVRLSEYGEARARYEEALPLYRTIGDRLGEANCIQALGDVHVRLSEYGEARARYEEALPLYRTIGDRLGEANCIKALGDVHVRLSEYGEARARYEEALPLYRTIGDRLGEANCIKALGDVHVRLSEYGEARARYEEALPLYRTIGARLGEANCIKALGDLFAAQEQYEQALEMLEEAARRYQSLGMPHDEAGAINSMANLYDGQGDNRAAVEAYTRALEIYISPMWYRNRANQYIKLGDAENAARDIEAATQLQPDHPYLYLRRGDLARLRQDYATAEIHYRATLERYPRLNSAHFGLGLVLLGLGRSNQALTIYQAGLENTFAADNLNEPIEDLIKLQSAQPDLSGLAEALALLREAQETLNQRTK